MKPRVKDTLKQMGFEGDVADFRRVLADVKADNFGEWSTDELCFTRDKAADYCTEVRKRLKAPRLTRVFILRALTGLRKNGGANPKAVAQSADGQAAR